MQIRLRTAILFISALFLNLTSCTDEPDLPEYTVVFVNTSGKSFTISMFYNDFGTPRIYDEFSLSESEEYKCSYKSESFLGIRGCLNNNSRGVDSLRIVFDNGRGYICVDEALSIQNFCARDFYTSHTDTFEEIGENIFQVSISQKDFENAFELPE
nr:hypothetical protein [uncultured Allomuricauda sp.]